MLKDRTSQKIVRLAGRLRERLVPQERFRPRPLARMPFSRLRGFFSRRAFWTLLGLTVVVATLGVVVALWPSAAPPAPPVAPPAPLPQEKLITGRVAAGQTLSTLLAPWLDLSAVHGLRVTTVTAGRPWKAILAPDGAFRRFEHDINDNDMLIVEKGAAGVTSRRVPIPYAVSDATIAGTISDSLFAAVDAAGEGDALAVMLADIFAYDIDFIRDIRSGDTFRALIEKRSRDGRPAGYGRILAAEFVNDGKSYRAYRFQDGGKSPGYYDGSGRSLKKAILRAPLPFSRVSSGFTMRRFHPIAKTWRAHPAIDYAAPAGTPIMAVGDASIVAIGTTAGNGNYIKLRHSGGLETMYLHMSRFAKGMRQGKRVRQGETIGFVGSTGLATGPHLCYRMTRNGAPVNPARIPTTPGEPVSRASLAAFQTQRPALDQRLAAIVVPKAPTLAPTPELQGAGGRE